MNYAPRSSRDRKYLLGSALAVVSAILFGFLGIFTAHLYQFGLEPNEVLFYRFLGASIVLFPFSIRGIFKLTRKQLLVASLFGLIGYTGQSYLFFVAIQETGSAIANFLLYLYPVNVVVLKFILDKVKPTHFQITSMILGFIGAVLVISSSFEAVGLLGPLAGFLAALWYAIYIKCSESFTKEIPPRSLALFVFVGSTLSFGSSLIFVGEWTPFSLELAPSILGLSVLSTALPILLFFSAIQIVGASQSSLMSNVEPVVMVCLGAFILGETLTPKQILGTLIIGVAIMVLNYPVFKRKGGLSENPAVK